MPLNVWSHKSLSYSTKHGEPQARRWGRKTERSEKSSGTDGGVLVIMAIEVVVVLVPRISHIRRRSAFDTEEYTWRAAFLGAADAVQRVLAELFEPESGAQSARIQVSRSNCFFARASSRSCSEVTLG